MLEVRFLINASVFYYYRVSLSKADAKLLLYNISAKCFRLLFQTFCKVFANSLICRCVLQQGFSTAL